LLSAGETRAVIRSGVEVKRVDGGQVVWSRMESTVEVVVLFAEVKLTDRCPVVARKRRPRVGVAAVGAGVEGMIGDRTRDGRERACAVPRAAIVQIRSEFGGRGSDGPMGVATGVEALGMCTPRKSAQGQGAEKREETLLLHVGRLAVKTWSVVGQGIPLPLTYRSRVESRRPAVFGFFSGRVRDYIRLALAGFRPRPARL